MVHIYILNGTYIHIELLYVHIEWYILYIHIEWYIYTYWIVHMYILNCTYVHIELYIYTYWIVHIYILNCTYVHIEFYICTSYILNGTYICTYWMVHMYILNGTYSTYWIVHMFIIKLSWAYWFWIVKKFWRVYVHCAMCRGGGAKPLSPYHDYPFFILWRHLYVYCTVYC